MTFPHKPHLSAEALKKDDLAQACLACHEWRKGGTEVNWPLKPTWTAPGKSTYGRCVSCHSHRGKAEAVNLKHEGAFADTCVICHVAGLEGGSLKNDRPQTTVKRRKPGTVFRITTQAHPFITGRTADATCSDCHRAKIPLLPSRLGLFET